MESMKDEEYTTKFLDFLRYLPYLKDEKDKVHSFVSGLPLTFTCWIEYDEARSLDEVIGNLKHCYELSKCKTKSQQGWKGKDKAKGKWHPKLKIPQDVGEKESVVSYKKFNGPQPRGKQNKGDGKGRLYCWTCGKEHLKRDCLYN